MSILTGSWPKPTSANPQQHHSTKLTTEMTEISRLKASRSPDRRIIDAD